MNADTPVAGALLSYSDIFAERGSAYDIAMQRYPRARDAEFEQIVAAAALRPGMRVGDVPAGGGYLARHVPDGVTCEGHEPCASFTNHGLRGKEAGRPLLPLPWGADELDAMLSLAGVHHLADKVPLFAEFARVVKPGGTLVVSDVAEGSPVARFLDGFVGDNNTTGHEGAFLSDRTCAELQAGGWVVDRARVESFAWRFESSGAMVDFTRHLFDIVRAPDEAVLRAIGEGPGCAELQGGGCEMNWALMTIVCHRPS